MSTARMIASNLADEILKFLDNYKGYQNEIKDFPKPMKAFFEVIEYVRTGSGEKGYLFRQRLFKEIESIADNVNDAEILDIIKKYYFSPEAGRRTRNAIQYACLSQSGITNDMIDEVAKHMPMESNEFGSENYQSAGPQSKAWDTITKLILNDGVYAIDEVKSKTWTNDEDHNEIEMRIR